MSRISRQKIEISHIHEDHEQAFIIWNRGKGMKKVLIVDDAAFIRKTLRLMLEKNNFEVVGEAENGKAAMIKIQSLAPDIVTLDITMPGMDGVECLNQISKLDKKPNVVMITALGRQDKVIEAFNSGAKGFIVKPFKEDNVVSTLRSMT